MKAVGYLAVLAIAIPVSILWTGYVLAVLWGWFVVPTFGLPALSIPAAFGIALIASFTCKADTYDLAKEDKPAGEQFVGMLAYSLLKPAAALVFGWAVNLWM